MVELCCRGNLLPQLVVFNIYLNWLLGISEMEGNFER